MPVKIYLVGTQVRATVYIRAHACVARPAIKSGHRRGRIKGADIWSHELVTVGFSTFDIAGSSHASVSSPPIFNSRVCNAAERACPSASLMACNRSRNHDAWRGCRVSMGAAIRVHFLLFTMKGGAIIRFEGGDLLLVDVLSPTRANAPH